ncbi:hypothetical protein EBZ39_10020 [bacterium]|nr:hypothetical protein [bacterium]
MPFKYAQYLPGVLFLVALITGVWFFLLTPLQLLWQGNVFEYLLYKERISVILIALPLVGIVLGVVGEKIRQWYMAKK